MERIRTKGWGFGFLALLLGTLALYSCQSGQSGPAMADAASAVYVAPGEYDEFYAFMSGGFSGNVTVHGLPSGRLLKTIPVFSQFPENGYGYSEETKGMLETSWGFIPWDDSHHPELSQTEGVTDGRWLFINGNNTPRVARIDLGAFETEEILEIPNSAGNHASPFVTENTEYVVASTRFSVPIPQRDMPISEYEGNFQGTISFIKADEPGGMEVAFQILVPGYNYDLSNPGRKESAGWAFLTSYNTEEAHTLLEVNASQHDKDFIAAVHWRRAEECVAQGAGTVMDAEYYHNHMGSDRIAHTEVNNSVRVLRALGLLGHGLLPPHPEITPRRGCGSVGRVHRGGREAGGGDPGPLLHQDDPGHRGRGLRDRGERHSGSPVRGHPGRGGPGTGARAPSYRVRRPGLRLHLHVHLLGDREVGVGNLAGGGPGPGLLFHRPPHDSRRGLGPAVGQVRHRPEQDHQGSLPAHRSRAGPRRPAFRHLRRQDEAPAGLPHHGRAPLRPGSPGRHHHGPSGPDVPVGGEHQPHMPPWARVRPGWNGTATPFMCT